MLDEEEDEIQRKDVKRIERELDNNEYHGYQNGNFKRTNNGVNVFQKMMIKKKKKKNKNKDRKESEGEDNDFFLISGGNDEIFNEKNENKDEIINFSKKMKKNEQKNNEQFNDFLEGIKNPTYNGNHMVAIRNDSMPKMISQNKVSKLVLNKHLIQKDNNDRFNLVALQNYFEALEEEEDPDFFSPIKLCSGIKNHEQQAHMICEKMMNYISSPDNCIKIIAHWGRTQLIPGISQDNENMFMITHILFSNISFELITNEGFILFEKFDENILKLVKSKNYTMTKHRFNIPQDMLVNLVEEDYLMILFSKCFYRPRIDSSGKNAEFINFAHNDLMHLYSANMRSNLLLAHVYLKLRLNIGNINTFKYFQHLFIKILNYINFLIYINYFKTTIHKETIEMINELKNHLLNNNLFHDMNQELCNFYKSNEIQSNECISDIQCLDE